MKKKYKTIDVRKLESKNRIILSDELMNLLGWPEEIVFSVVRNEENKEIRVNNPHCVIGKEVARSKVENHGPYHRCVVPKGIIQEMPEHQKFVGFFLPYSVEMMQITKHKTT